MGCEDATSRHHPAAAHSGGVAWLLAEPLEEVASGASKRLRPLLVAWLWTLRVVAPVLLVLVLYSNFGVTMGAIQALRGG